MTIHRLKTLPPYWDAVDAGYKTFEVRRDDRGFQRGDILELVKYDPYHGGMHHSCVVRRRVTYILTGGQLGIQPGYVVMGLEAVETVETST